MKAGLLTLLLAARLAAHAQAGPAAGAPLASFIPPGYHQLPDGRATGDLNADGRPDLALALVPAAEDSVEKGSGGEGLPPRLLVVLFSQPGGRYRLAAQGRRALLCKGCGGQFDPFDQLTIAKGLVVLDQQGGGSGRWSVSSKFRYQQGDFFLIGETRATIENGATCPNETVRDTNLLTGITETTTTTASCDQRVRRSRRPVAPLRKLAAYEVAEE